MASRRVTPSDDFDGDGVTDSLDNCPLVSNPAQTDDDADGYGAACDCDDTDSLINPATVWYEDADEDGYGNVAVMLTQCETPAGFVLDGADCNDTNPNIHPLATELCNGIDDNCDTQSDEGLGDTDGDGWGAACDNCPDDFNPDQADADSNGVGDACDVVVCLVGQTGDVTNDGSLTSADIIYMVNFVFKAGPAPLPCEAAGDVECSGTLTSADIIYLVNHIFKAGPMPCDVCPLIASGTWTCP